MQCEPNNTQPPKLAKENRSRRSFTPSPPHPLTPSSSRKRGSVLLITVVLLLVLAIMGTSYLFTTRMDRITSGGDVDNSRIDTLVDGVRDMATSFIVNGLFGVNNVGGVAQYQFRGNLPLVVPPPPPTPAPQPVVPPKVPASPVGIIAYNNYDIPDYQGNGSGDPWLADRVPVLVGGKPTWPAITAPMYTYSLGALGMFESPVQQQGGTANGPPDRYFHYTNLQPTFMPLSNGASHPALTDPNALGGAATYIAGDADGDGIADCGLMRLSGAFADGITYYAGVRIIDNNSAVNVNTAWDDQYDYDFTDKSMPITGLFPSYFPSAVGLAQMIEGPDAPAPAADPFNTTLTPYRVGPGAPPSQVTPYNDLGAARADFTHKSLGDAIYHQLTRRLSNPGFNGGANGAHYQAFGDADAAALAYHFGMVNPSSFGPVVGGITQPMTAVEQLLTPYTFRNAPNYPGTTNPNIAAGRAFNVGSAGPNVINWYNANFNPVPAANNNLRPLLVTRNGVSNQIAANSSTVPVLSAPPTIGVTWPTVGNAAMPPYGDRGRWSPGVTYGAGDCVTYAGTTGAPSTNVPPGSMFSGVFFAIPTNPNAPPNRNTPPTTGVSPSDLYWRRPIRFVSTASYNVGDYVFLDGYNAVPGDGYEFYQSLTGASTTPSLASALAAGRRDWTLWQPSGSAAAVKANVNTALFPELFRAYWNVMTAMDQNGNPATPFDSPTANGNILNKTTYIYYGSHFGAAVNGSSAAAVSAISLTGATHSEEMFRSPVRDGPFRTTPAFGNNTAMYFQPYEVLKLRAAIAAVNTENLREPGVDVIARQIPLTMQVGNSAAGATPVNVVIYGNQPQPYITEVYAQTDVSTVNAVKNPQGYFAIKLYNPYPYDIPLIGNGVTVGTADYSWQLAAIDRTKQVKTLTPIAAIDSLDYSPGTRGVPIVPANGYLLLENYSPSGTVGNSANYRPSSSGLPLNGAIPFTNLPIADPNYRRGTAPLAPLNVLFVPTLGSAQGKELVILKRRHFNGTVSTGPDGTYGWNDASGAGGNINDWVPVDSFDFSALALGGPAAAPKTAFAIHYVRNSFNWQFVHGGRYDGSNGGYFQQGTQSENWDPSVANSENWASGPPTPGMSLGTFFNNTAAAAALTTPVASYSPNFTIQLCNPNWAGPNASPTKVPGSAMTALPFGGYLRDGDILETPFIAAYRIEDATTGALYELNTVSMDASFAEDTDLTDDPPPALINTVTYEQVGRFCPLIPPPTPNTNGINDNLKTGVNQRYGWARSLFDYLTVQSPRDDYQPNSDPSLYPNAIAPTPVANSDASLTPNPVGSSSPQFGVANTDAENTESVQGKVNINTAPQQVLQALPWVVSNTGVVDAAASANVATAIINYRKTLPGVPGTGGPFTSIFDLNNIGGFPLADIAGNFTGGSTPAQGNVTNLPAGTLGTTPSAPNEFDEMYLNMTRLSNLITTRSDTFTVYIVVEGWQNAGNNAAPFPTLVTTRRAAFIVDRNTVTPFSRNVRTVNVPNN